MATVLIVEDDQPTRDHLASAVDAASDLNVVAAVGTCSAARDYLRSAASPSVMLVDLGLPDGNGVELIRESRALDPPPEVMVISVFGDERHVVTSIEAGASGYLLKDATDVADSVRQLLAGGSPISSSIARHVLRRFRQAGQPAPERANERVDLTPRETEILKLVARGFAYGEIATMLELSIHTVTTHVKNTYRKLEVNSRGEAVFEAAQLGIVELKR